jgi:hypothetical protein
MSIMIALVTTRSAFYEDCVLCTAPGTLNSSDVTFLGNDISSAFFFKTMLDLVLMAVTMKSTVFCVIALYCSGNA